MPLLPLCAFMAVYRVNFVFYTVLGTTLNCPWTPFSGSSLIVSRVAEAWGCVDSEGLSLNRVCFVGLDFCDGPGRRVYIVDSAHPHIGRCKLTNQLSTSARNQHLQLLHCPSAYERLLTCVRTASFGFFILHSSWLHFTSSWTKPRSFIVHFLQL
jgi:hypothetical protein